LLPHSIPFVLHLNDTPDWGLRGAVFWPFKYQSCCLNQVLAAPSSESRRTTPACLYMTSHTHPKHFVLEDAGSMYVTSATQPTSIKYRNPQNSIFYGNINRRVIIM
jgi:hypothetical protein